MWVQLIGYNSFHTLDAYLLWIHLRWRFLGNSGLISVGFLNAEIVLETLAGLPDVFHTEVPSVYQTQQTSSHLLFPMSLLSLSSVK